MGTLGARLVVGTALCVVSLAGCTGEQPPAPPAVDGSPVRPAEVDDGAPAAPARPAAAVPFDVTVAHIAVEGLDNAEILGVAGIPPNEAAAVAAVSGARHALATFLDAQLVAPATRFSAGPIDALLTARALGALTDADRAGLGQVAMAVERTVTGPATVRAQVLLVGDQVDVVTLTYEAHLTVVRDDGTHLPMAQAGSMTLLPTESGWRADAVEVTTHVPEGAA